MARRRPRRVTIALPGEKRYGRRSFLVKGVVGGALLAVGGGSWLATRRTRAPGEPVGPLRIFSAQEAAVLLAVADRMVPERAGFPRPRQLGLAVKMDAVAAMADPVTQGELRQLVRLFESALAGGILDGQPRLFTTCTPAQQDRRLAAWSGSRLALRRTGFRALQRLVYAAYYASPDTWAAVGYPGPPIRPGSATATPAEPPPAPAPAPPPRRRRRRVEPAPISPEELLAPKVDGDGRARGGRHPHRP